MDATSPVDLIFGPLWNDGIEDARHVFQFDGLMKLKELQFNFQVFEYAWCEISSHHTLRIGRGCSPKDCDILYDVESSISTLSWDKCTVELKIKHCEETIRFLLRFLSSKDLKIRVSKHYSYVSLLRSRILFKKVHRSILQWNVPKRHYISLSMS